MYVLASHENCTKHLPPCGFGALSLHLKQSLRPDPKRVAKVCGSRFKVAWEKVFNLPLIVMIVQILLIEVEGDLT